MKSEREKEKFYNFLFPVVFIAIYLFMELIKGLISVWEYIYP